VQADHAGSVFERDFDTPLVDRRMELEQLRRAFRRSVDERTCHLFTLLGSAGIGKTRLAFELFEASADEATILVGRCLPYGDGITFWPLTEALQEIGNVEDLVREMDDADLILERLLGMTGQTTVGSQETFWGVRKVCEALARQRPLVLCFEDVHWAEPTFLDLIEYLVGWIRDAPILLVCLARPEFLDEHRAWLSRQEHATSLTLSPLSPSDSEALLDALGVTGDARSQIAAAAEGNPLYAEQMAAMLAEGGYSDGLFTIPPTIQALLAARLDRLTVEERAAIERAAVCGKEFWRDAVVALTPSENRERIGAVLMSLMRKDLVRPHRSAVRPDDAFHFGHALIRDAAYAAVPKEMRALLHERFAGWLETEPNAAEPEEIVGYHYEQAYRNREQLGPMDDHARSLSERAGELLGRAGRRAFARDDVPAAITLLDRAVALVTDQDPVKLELTRELSMALWWAGEVARSEALLNGLIEAATATGDRRQAWYGMIERAARSVLSGDSVAEDLLRLSEDAIAVFEELGDDFGLARAWRRAAHAHQLQSRYGAAADASERALVHARRAADRQEEARIVDGLCTAFLYGPARAPEAIERCSDMLDWARGSRVMEANVGISLAGLKAMVGDFEEARALSRAAEQIYEELGLRLAVAGLTQVAGPLELLAGDAAAAEQQLRKGFEILDRVSSPAYQAALLAEVLYVQDRYDEADRFATISEHSSAGNKIAAEVVWRGVRARLGARSGTAPDAVLALAEEATIIAGRTDALNLRGDAAGNLAETLALVGREEAAASVAREAVELYERKGNVVAARRAATLISSPVR